MLFVLTLDHTGNAFLYFDLCGHGKLDLKFVHGRAEKKVGSNKICQIKVYISKAEIGEESNREGWFISRHIYLGKQLLPQINNCCQEVLQNNEKLPHCPTSKTEIFAQRARVDQAMGLSYRIET